MYKDRMHFRRALDRQNVTGASSARRLAKSGLSPSRTLGPVWAGELLAADDDGVRSAVAEPLPPRRRDGEERSDEVEEEAVDQA